MNRPSSDTSLSINIGHNVKKVLWLDTSYFNIPLYILNMIPDFSPWTTSVKPTYMDFSLEFQFKKISDIDIKMICTLLPEGDPIPKGDYKIQFYYDINIFNEDTKVLEMQSGETVVEKDFSLKSYLENLSLRDLGKQFEIKVLVKIIEYDSLLTTNQVRQMNLFRIENDQIFKYRSVLNDLCYILNVSRFESLFKGRQNLKYITERRHFIKRTSIFSRQIDRYLKCKNQCTTPPFTDLEVILNYLLHGEKYYCCNFCKKISAKDLLKVYRKAHHLGLNFLIELSQDCLLNKLEEYETLDLRKFEDYIFDVLGAAAHVNDERLFERAEKKLIKSELFLTSTDPLERYLKTSVASRFVIHFSNQRLKKSESNNRIGNEEDSLSQSFESLRIA